MTSAAPLPLFETHTLKAIQAEREAILKQLRRGGRDARARMHLEDKVRKLTAQQIEIETKLGIGRRA
jgi:hypothetical protein